MHRQLKKKYVILLLPSVAGLAFIYGTKKIGLVDISATQLPGMVPPMVFILSVAFAVALPIFYRSCFAHRRRHCLSVSEKDLFSLEGNSIFLVMVTPYLALLAYLFELPRFHQCGTILMALYAVYYFYPSKRRLAFQLKIFRVQNADTSL
jgi:hypothetical protein